MRTAHLVGVIVVAAFIGGGVVVLHTGPAPSSGENQGESSGSEPRNAIEFEVAPNKTTEVSGNASIAVVIEIKLKGINRSYEDLQLCAYDANGNVITSRSVGTVQAPNHSYPTYNITTNVLPRYYLLTHQREDSDGIVYREILEWQPDGERYREVNPDERDSDFPLPTESGTCA